MFITGFRHLRKNKLFAAINILSLSIGISATVNGGEFKTIQAAMANPVESLRDE